MLDSRMVLDRGQCIIHRQRNAGFTLIEVLLVVVIMAILAGTVISSFLGTADDAKTSSLQHNLSVVEVQARGLPRPAPQLLSDDSEQRDAATQQRHQRRRREQRPVGAPVSLGTVRH